MPPIRLLVSDVDRTLLARDYTLPERVVETMQRIRDAGTTIVLASARSPVAIRPIAEGLGIDPVMIAFNGGWTGRWGEAPDDERPLSGATAAAIAEAAEADGGDVVWFTADTAHIREATRLISDELAVTGERTARVERWEPGLPAPGKLLVIARDGVGGPLADSLRAAFGAKAQVVRSHETLVEITAPGVTKAAAAERLAERLGLTADEVAAAGDGENDIGLLTWAGLSLAPSNAIRPILDLADAIGGDCDDGGIADALEAVLARAEADVSR
jgi:Cof subfamily protein (haloacid dehalogenase superfamily)